MSDSFANLLTRRSSKIPVVPYVCSFASTISGVSVRELMNSPSLLSKSVADAQRLFGYDAVLNIFDTTLEAEALGCQVDWGDGHQPPKVVSHPLSEGRTLTEKDVVDLDQKGRISLVLDATRRLAALTENRVVLVGTLTGPATLARHLLGDGLLRGLNGDRDEVLKVLSLCSLVATKIAKAICEAKADAVMIVEETVPLLRLQDVGPVLRSFRPLLNVLRYYDTPSVLLAQDCSQEAALEICRSGLGSYSISGGFSMQDIQSWANEHHFRYGGVVPTRALGSHSEAANAVRMLRGEGAKDGFFISTEWEVPVGTEPDTIRAIVQESKRV